MSLAEYEKTDALGLAELVKNGDVTALEVVEEAITRAEALNPRLNAIVFEAFDSARERARMVEAEGLFAGVPLLLKDMRAGCTGMPTRNGSHFMPAIPADHDSTLVARYKAAGFLALGKTNVPEFGILPTTESKLYGPAHNPWNLDRTPGGSSGGSAAAVAARIVPMAHATDGGGSIRIPASCCGLVGLKVSRGRITQGPDVADSTSGLSVDHVVSRTVRDSAAALDISCAPDRGDPYFALPPYGSYLQGIREKSKRLRIAVAFTALNGSRFAPEVLQAVEKTAKLCEQLGHTVEEASPQIDYDRMILAFMTIWATSTAYGVASLARLTGNEPSPDSVEGLTFGLYEAGIKTTAVQLIEMQQVFYGLARIAAAFHRTYDVWLTPTLGEEPLRLGTIDVDERDVHKAFEPLFSYVPFTAMQNATGQPGINVPLHWSQNGLPIGVQFVARSGDEMVLLKLAAELEEASPWIGRRPPLIGER